MYIRFVYHLAVMHRLQNSENYESNMKLFVVFKRCEGIIKNQEKEKDELKKKLEESEKEVASLKDDINSHTCQVVRAVLPSDSRSLLSPRWNRSWSPPSLSSWWFLLLFSDLWVVSLLRSMDGSSFLLYKSCLLPWSLWKSFHWMESLYRYTLLGIALIIGFLLFLVIDASLALLFVKSIICKVRYD